MDKILKPLFDTVVDYPTLKKRVALLTWIAAIGGLALLSSQVSQVSEFLGKAGPSTTVFGLTISLMYLVLTLPFALLARIVKLHDTLSDVLRVRHRFDVFNVLFPLAAASGASLSAMQLGRVAQSRRALMNAAFYRYASSTKPAIDEHLIHEALDTWSWIWVLSEALVVTALVSVVLVVYGRLEATLWLALGAVIAIALMRLLYVRCSRLALDEVAAITSDNERKMAIRALFHAL
jgi:hypothetical protein